MRSYRLVALSAIGLSLAFAVCSAGPARAAAIDFTVDTANTSVSITDQSGGGFFCFLTSCGVEASIASGLPGNFSVDETTTHSLDFITWTANGSTGFSSRTFNVEATLAFSFPAGATTTSGGGGFAYFLSGTIIAGALHWNDVPQQFTLGDGSVIDVDFQGGLSILPLVGCITTEAYVTVESIGTVSSAAAPLPAAAPLFGSGLGLLGLLGWRKKRKTAALAS